MTQLQTEVARWLSTWPTDLVNSARLNHEPIFPIALRCVEVMKPLLETKKDIYLSEAGSIRVFVYGMYDEQGVSVGIVKVTPDGNLKPIHKQLGKQGMLLAAAFMCDFPNALFSIDGGIPLFIEPEGNETQTAKKLFCLENFRQLIDHGAHRFKVSYPQPQAQPNPTDTLTKNAEK